MLRHLSEIVRGDQRHKRGPLLRLRGAEQQLGLVAEDCVADRGCAAARQLPGPAQGRRGGAAADAELRVDRRAQQGVAEEGEDRCSMVAVGPGMRGRDELRAGRRAAAEERSVPGGEGGLGRGRRAGLCGCLRLGNAEYEGS